MQVISHQNIKTHELPGLVHKTLCNRHNGNQKFEVWQQTIKGTSSTPVHKHDCEEVIVILSGKGHCFSDDEQFDFSADQTLIIPANAVHQIINTGKEDLEILATLSMSPVVVQTRDGSRLALPWDADDCE